MNITIIVSGQARSGKTTIAQLIANCLKQFDFNVDVQHQDGEEIRDVNAEIFDRLKNVKQQKTTISIVEITARK
jgi:adenylylsulfate kinase-like enzyme